MSAFLSVPYEDRVEILADGASCWPSGKLLACVDKIRPSPHLPLALVGRGQAGDLRQIEDTVLGLTEGRTVNETLHALMHLLAEGAFPPGRHPYEVVIAAITEFQGPAHYIFRSVATPPSKDIIGMEPFKLYDFTDTALSGGCEIDREDYPENGVADGLKPIAVQVFDAMRRKAGGSAFGTEGAYWIGGHIDHAVIDKNGVRIERVHEWPDVLGRKIDPWRTGEDEIARASP